MLLMLFQQRREAFYQLFALRKRRARPGRESLACSCAGRSHVIYIGRIGLPQRQVIQRIGFAELSAPASLPDAIN
ncbi:hypothetical protein D3C81_2094840 [compost metagenome]